MIDPPIELMGVPSSPYTRKMVALLRFRRIPYRWRNGAYGTGVDAGRPQPKVQLLPTFYLPDANGNVKAEVDSTQIIARLEATHAERSVRPPDPAMAVLSDLVEDFADEWLTKLMYHHRWAKKENLPTIGAYLVYSMSPGMPAEAGRQMAAYFTARQVERLARVGSNARTGSIIEEGYVRVMKILEPLVEGQGFLLGTRPSAADFAVYGQLLPLVVVDVSSVGLAWQTSPRLRGWVDFCEDLSGLELNETGWLEPTAASLRPLLEEIGRTYVPFILANERAILADEPSFEIEICGRPWRQDVQTYGLRCLGMLRAAHTALEPTDRARLHAALEGTGCEELWKGPPSSRAGKGP